MNRRNNKNTLSYSSCKKDKFIENLVRKRQDKASTHNHSRSHSACNKKLFIPAINSSSLKEPLVKDTRIDIEGLFKIIDCNKDGKIGIENIKSSSNLIIN